MDELQIQSLIVKSVKNDWYGYGYKTNNKFVAGVPDLFLATPELGPFFLEVKLLHNFSITELQKINIRELRRCGVVAGIVIINGDKGTYDIAATHNPDALPVHDMPHFTKNRGEPWPINKIYHAIKGGLP